MMRRHLWMHGATAVGLVAVVGLSWMGVAIPSGVYLLFLLACPLMMVTMMAGMDHGSHDGHSHEAHHQEPTDASHDSHAQPVHR